MDTRSPEILGILASLVAALVFATVIGYWLKLRRPADSAILDLNIRIHSWWPLLVVSGGALLLGPIAVVLLFCVVSLLALREFSATPLGVVICAGGIAHIPALMLLRIPGYQGREPNLMVYIVLIAQASDILQYISGKLIGRHPVAPAISPAKTVEGTIGGILGATLLGAALFRITPFTMRQSALMSFTITVFGFAGGLAMSAIKRNRGIKDWSSLIAGHGGVLDRIDSLCFSAPIFFYLTRHFFT